jgi:adenosylcobinamide-GDP ribazoletransferase
MTTLATDLRAAIALLTRWPVSVAAGTARAGAAAFPLVGLGVGLLAAIPVLVVGTGQPVLAAFAALAVAAIVTGGLHLDGLADTADALMAPDPARAEAARRDPRVGSGGVIGLVLVIGAEVAAIAGVVEARSSVFGAAAVVVAMVVGRSVPIVTVGLERRAATTSGGGFGAWFAGQVRPADVALAIGLAALAVAVVGVVVASPLPAVWALGGLLVGGVVSSAIRAARGGWDGDALGAVIELTVLATLATAAVVGG